MKPYILFFLGLQIIFINVAFAERLNMCKPTTEIVHNSVPDSFSSYNDLHHGLGSLFVAKGKKIYVRGKIMDQNCVPVVGAVVSIWQANSAGLMQWNKNNDYEKITNEKITLDANVLNYDPNFTGTGSSITNNMGDYEFITILPGEFDSSVSINFLVTHSEFDSFQTELYLSKNDDATLLPQKIEQNIYTFNIVLKGKNAYLKY